MATEVNLIMTVETKNEAVNSNRTNGKAPKIVSTSGLIVGEDPAMCQTIKDVFSTANIETVMANCADAEGLIYGKKFDVILVDVNASEGDDAALVQKIRRSGLNQKTLIIMISEDQRPNAVSKAFGAGASFLVYKPIDRAHLTRLTRATQGTIEHERRRFRRITVQAKVRVQSADETAEGETIDLSLNGTLVQASITFPVGSIVEVRLYLRAGMDPVVGTGSVKRVMAGNRMGIELVSLPISESRRLQEYLLPFIAV
jgi:CheY-like chemotaxis protein